MLGSKILQLLVLRDGSNSNFITCAPFVTHVKKSRLKGRKNGLQEGYQSQTLDSNQWQTVLGKKCTFCLFVYVYKYLLSSVYLSVPLFVWSLWLYLPVTCFVSLSMSVLVFSPNDVCVCVWVCVCVSLFPLNNFLGTWFFYCL